MVCDDTENIFGCVSGEPYFSWYEHFFADFIMLKYPMNKPFQFLVVDFFFLMFSAPDFMYITKIHLDFGRK